MSQPPSDDDRTVFIPSAGATPAGAEFVARPAAGRIEVGSLLNNIYEVRRFIARGGMGEVYEGVNVASEERVAIKVMLPHLASDPKVLAMFRKEARTLTRLSHPALVQYRVLAQEPGLGVLYIVTEFIDGPTLSDMLGRMQPDEAQLRFLLRRLAEGLGAAHDLGAVHRDISPDNVIFAGGRLESAKIIDFGIAKDVDPSQATIVGDGFAGKLGFVAPEQFGDYGRQIGPWTDIYSLGLVLMALVAGRPVDMGATLVEAIERRRAGPDLSPLPPSLRPLFGRMLAPDPANRLRSMPEVLAALSQAPEAVDAQVSTRVASRGDGPAESQHSAAGRKPSRLVLAGALAGGALILVVGLSLFFGRNPSRKAEPGSVEVASSQTGSAALRSGPDSPAERLITAIEAQLPMVNCTWLELDPRVQHGDRLSATLHGVAASTLQAHAAVASAVKRSGGGTVDVDTSDVAQVAPALCNYLDAVRPLHSRTNSPLVTSSQPTWQIKEKEQSCPDYQRAAVAVVEIDPRTSTGDFALIGVEEDGSTYVFFQNRDELLSLSKSMPATVVSEGANRWRLNICGEKPGLNGLLMIKGRGPFPKALFDNGKAPNTEWRKRFSRQAAEQGWTADMAWYRVVGQPS